MSVIEVRTWHVAWWSLGLAWSHVDGPCHVPVSHWPPRTCGKSPPNQLFFNERELSIFETMLSLYMHERFIRNMLGYINPRTNWTVFNNTTWQLDECSELESSPVSTVQWARCLTAQQNGGHVISSNTERTAKTSNQKTNFGHVSDTWLPLGYA